MENGTATFDWFSNEEKNTPAMADYTWRDKSTVGTLFDDMVTEMKMQMESATEVDNNISQNASVTLSSSHRFFVDNCKTWCIVTSAVIGAFVIFVCCACLVCCCKKMKRHKDNQAIDKRMTGTLQSRLGERGSSYYEYLPNGTLGAWSNIDPENSPHSSRYFLQEETQNDVPANESTPCRPDSLVLLPRIGPNRTLPLLPDMKGAKKKVGACTFQDKKSVMQLRTVDIEDGMSEEKVIDILKKELEKQEYTKEYSDKKVSERRGAKGKPNRRMIIAVAAWSKKVDSMYMEELYDDTVSGKGATLIYHDVTCNPSECDSTEDCIILGDNRKTDYLNKPDDTISFHNGSPDQRIINDSNVEILSQKTKRSPNKENDVTYLEAVNKIKIGKRTVSYISMDRNVTKKAMGCSHSNNQQSTCLREHNPKTNDSNLKLSENKEDVYRNEIKKHGDFPDKPADESGNLKNSHVRNEVSGGRRNGNSGVSYITIDHPDDQISSSQETYQIIDSSKLDMLPENQDNYATHLEDIDRIDDIKDTKRNQEYIEPIYVNSRVEITGDHERIASTRYADLTLGRKKPVPAPRGSKKNNMHGINAV